MRSTKRWIGPVTALLFVLSALPASAASRAGTWRGDTSQDFGIRFIVGDDERVKTVKVTIEYESDECILQVTWEFGLDSRIRDDGTFRLDLVDDQDDRDTALILGEFVTRQRAEGTFRSSLVEGGGCGDLKGKGTWTAKRVSDPAA